MTPEQRAAVRANANYLRNVRPIDPEEIYEYVDGRPHPAVVRRVLREEALDLGLIEHDDGTFEPVSDAPVASRVGTIESFPDRYADRVEELLVERYGADWPTGESGDRLRRVIRRLKEDYYRGHDVEYDIDVALGYAVYHLPDYYAAIQYVLDDLTQRRLLPRRLRVLDIGAGVGGPALGLHDFLPWGDDSNWNEADSDTPPANRRESPALVEYHAVEPSPAADVLVDLLDETDRNFHATIHRSTAEAFDPDGEYDLVLFANVLSELAAPVDVVARYAESLAGDGAIVAVAPADRETSTHLREVERAVGDGLTVYSPTIRLWPGEPPGGRCWSFDVKPDLRVPEFQRRLDDADGGSGEFVNVDVQYSYTILRTDEARRVAFDPDPNRLAKMAETERHVTDRIDIAAIKLSRDLGQDHPLFLIGDGSQRVDHYAVLTNETTLNRALRTADYGALLVFEGVLVLWNDDEEAYNLVVDDETVVDRLE